MMIRMMIEKEGARKRKLPFIIHATDGRIMRANVATPQMIAVIALD